MKKLFKFTHNLVSKRLSQITIAGIVVLAVLFFGIQTANCNESINAHCTTQTRLISENLPEKLEDWVISEKLKTFTPDTLFDFVNGGAYFYFDHGFECLTLQAYKKRNADLLLEVYRFKDRSGARKIYSSETTNKSQQLALGEQGFVGDKYLSFYRGKFFIKVTTFIKARDRKQKELELQDGSHTGMVQLARRVDRLIAAKEDNLEREASVSISQSDKEQQANNFIVLIGASYAKGWPLDQVAGMPVVNKGISGEQSFEMLARFEKDVIALNPNVVIIWGYINDIHRADRNRIDEAASRSKESIKQMVDISLNNGIIPVLATEVTIRPKDDIKETIAGWIGNLLGKKSYQDIVNERVMALNQWLKSFADENYLLVLDLQPLIAEDSSNKRKKEYATEDGTHITNSGYSVLTEYAIKIMKDNFHK